VSTARARKRPSRNTPSKRHPDDPHVPASSVRRGHLIVHRLLSEGFPEPVVTTVSVEPTAGRTVHLRLTLADQQDWAQWARLMEPGREVQAIPAEVHPYTRVLAVGRIDGLRTSLTVDVPSGTPLLDPSSVHPNPPGADGSPGPMPGTDPGALSPRGAGVPTTTEEQ
jgi:hypothetical protein